MDIYHSNSCFWIDRLCILLAKQRKSSIFYFTYCNRYLPGGGVGRTCEEEEDGLSNFFGQIIATPELDEQISSEEKKEDA